MSWNQAKASTWMKRYADDLASDAYKEGGEIEWMYAAAGAAYYGVIHGIGYNTEKEFRQFLKNHIKLSDVFIDEAVEEIVK